VEAQDQIDAVVAEAQADRDVLAVILYGSRARGESQAGSDVDVCLVLTPGRRDAATLGRIRLRYASLGDLDLQVFASSPSSTSWTGISASSKASRQGCVRATRGTRFRRS
jgi:predicted nucleotidyltransferase